MKAFSLQLKTFESINGKRVFCSYYDYFSKWFLVQVVKPSWIRVSLTSSQQTYLVQPMAASQDVFKPVSSCISSHCLIQKHSRNQRHIFLSINTVSKHICSEYYQYYRQGAILASNDYISRHYNSFIYILQYTLFWKFPTGPNKNVSRIERCSGN